MLSIWRGKNGFASTWDVLGILGHWASQAYHDNVAQESCSLARNVMGHLLEKNVSREREITNAITIEIKKRSECVHDFQVHRSEKNAQFYSVSVAGCLVPLDARYREGSANT